MKLLRLVLVTCLVAGAAGLWIGGRVRSPSQLAAEAQAAVRALYTAVGYEPATVDGGVDDAVKAVESAEDAVEAAERSLASASAAAARSVTAAETEVDSAKTDLATAQTNGALALGEAQARASDAQEALGELQGDENATPAQIRAAEMAVLEADNAVARVTAENASAAEAASGRVRIAEQALQDARSSAATAGESAALAAAKTALADARDALTAVRAQSGVVVPGSEFVAVNLLPAEIASIGLQVGESLPGGPVLTFSSGSPLVEAWITPAQRSVVSAGDVAVMSIGSAEITGEVASIGADLTVSPRGLDGHRIEIVASEPIPASALGSEAATTIEWVDNEGCIGISEAAIYGDLRRFMQLNSAVRSSLRKEVRARIKAAPAYAEAASAWVACMQQQGYDFAEPADGWQAVIEAYALEPLEAAMALEAEIAPADGRCSEESGLFDAVDAEMLRAAEEVVAEREGEILAYRELIAAAVANAKELLDAP